MSGRVPVGPGDAGSGRAGVSISADLSPDPHPDTGDEWTVNALALALALDRRTVTKRLQSVPPSRTHGKTRYYRLADAVRALFGHPTLIAEAEFRFRQLQAATEKAEVGVRARKEELVDRAEVRRLLVTRAKAERDAHLTWVSRVTPILAAEAGADAGRLHAALDRELREHLLYLASTPLEGLLRDGQ